MRNYGSNVLPPFTDLEKHGAKALCLLSNSTLTTYCELDLLLG